MKKTMNIQVMILVLALCTTRVHAAAGGDSREGHAHAAAEEQGESHSQRVAVTQEQVARLGIEITRAIQGSLRREIRVPAEITVNSDRIAHVVPQAAGVVLEVAAVLGQRVEKGQVLAVLSSRDLAEAKAEYLASVERLNLSQEIYNREERLHAEKVSPERDFLAAKQTLAERKIMERSARQKLLMFGELPSTLSQLAIAPEDEFAMYRVVSPFYGTVIRKDIVRGEVIEKTEIFVIADLSTVWVDLAISPDAISLVREGQTVTIHLPDGSLADAAITYVSPVVDAETRMAQAHACLPNPTGQIRPGTFVDARILVPSTAEAVVIPKASLQLVNDRSCVFVWGQGDFEVREVTTGVSDGQQIEILQGLRVGELVASVNAFHLKAEAVKSADAGCGGHGHAH